MCGIAGIFQLKGTGDLGAQIGKMTGSMAHRGPDAEGHWIEGPVALGHRRLSIIDLSSTGNQPYASHNGRYKMVFNGELYNFREVKERIADHVFKSTGDTEVLMEAWSRWQLDAVHQFRGMFAFGVWDQREETLWLVRDRLGVKPLYYCQKGDQFLFASEIQSLLAALPGKKEINEQALAGYFRYQSVPGDETIITGIRELKAGCCLKISRAEQKLIPWWDITRPGKQYQFGTKKQVREQVRDLLRNAIAQRLVSDVPVGAFLSGGIDSSAVVALMAEVSSQRPETFNISFQEKEYDESGYAEMVARKFNTNHHRILQKPEYILDNLIPALDAMDTPSGDGINSYIVSKSIRDAGIKVALSGIGGDELFGGYPFFKQYDKLRQLGSLWPVSKPLRQLASAFLSDANSRKDRLKQLLSTSDVSIPTIYPLLRQITGPAAFRKYLNIDAAVTDPIQQRLEGLEGSKNFPVYSQVSIAEYLGYTQYTLLKDTDQMSMAVSLEVREPFFDHELIEYVLQVPDEFKRLSYPKQLLVESLGELLPPEIVHRPKQGFVFPWEQWIKTSLRSFCQERIDSLSERSFVKADPLRRAWSDFLQGDPGIRWMEIWLFIVIDYWLTKNECS